VYFTYITWKVLYNAFSTATHAENQNRCPTKRLTVLNKMLKKLCGLWEKRARDRVGASTHQNSLVLQNSLPLYLNQLVDQLSNRIVRTSARITADEVESTRIGKLHRQERAGYADYSMTQLIFEYQLSVK
jgi:hypothetical protein